MTSMMPSYWLRGQAGHRRDQADSIRRDLGNKLKATEQHEDAQDAHDTARKKVCADIRTFRV